MHLRGAAIGNGWTDARNQYPSYLDYAVMHGLVDESSQVSNSIISRALLSPSLTWSTALQRQQR
jgi:carboxypeptidase C (cathepsin A)